MTSTKKSALKDYGNGAEASVDVGTRKKSAGRVNGRNANVAARVDAERAALLAERQTELDKILDRHDDLIREAFHLEKFRTLVSYNPKEAKADTSTVFEEYKAQYDLLGNSSTSVETSRRTTRRSHQERVELLKGPVAGPSTPLVMAPPPVKSKEARPLQQRDTSIWDILADAKGKGKGKGKGKETAETEPPTPKLSKRKSLSKSIADNPNPLLTPKDSTKRSYKGKKRTSFTGEPRSVGAVIDLVDDHQATSIPAHTRGRPSLPNTSIHGSVVSSDAFPPPQKRQRVVHDLDDSRPPVSQFPPHVDLSSQSKSHRSRRSQRRKVTPHAAPEPAPPTPPNLPIHTPSKAKIAAPLEPTSSVKRIKLIVRRPPPTYTNPRQQPPPPRFGNSLSSLLSSYVILDGNERSSVELEHDARKKAIFMEQVHSLQKQGRMLLRPDLATVSDRNAVSVEIKRGMDAWDYIVEEMQNHHGERDTGQQIASSIAKKMRAHWESMAMKEGSARIAEEKRMKKLVKARSIMVVAEWKKAVFHIREQERLAREAEETKKGREHLDAILTQSGQILESQQFDLSRAGRSGSRSSSVSASLRDWEEDDKEEDVGDEESEHLESDEEEITDREGDIDDVYKEIGKEAEEQALSEAGTRDITENEEDSSEGDDDTTALALLGGPVQTAAEDVSSSLLFEADLVDEPDMFDGSSHGDYAPSTQGDDTFSPSSDLVATPSNDPVANSPPATSYAEPHNPYSSHHSIDYDLAPSLPHPLDTVIFHHDHDDIHPIGMPSPFKERNLPSSTDISSFKDMEVDAPATPPRSEPVFDENMFVRSSVEGSEIDTEPRLPKSFIPKLSLDVEDLRLKSRESYGSERREGITVTPAELEADETTAVPEDFEDEEVEDSSMIPHYLKPYAVAPVEWDAESQVKPPVLLRGMLRPYQQAGLEWLASLHVSNLNGILADEMGLGKTIQTIALLAHLACDRGIWGPHLIIVPTSVLLNWEMEFKKFLPGFKVLAYHGPTKRRKELRQGWNDKFHFNVCITSYTLASRDAHIFKRKPWYYMILDEAHMIKNFKSQRWNILLMFRSFRRLLLTGTPLQNNLTELWALLQFLMSGANFANLKEFGEWFSNPLEKAIEMGNVLDDEIQQRVSKLHTVLRPYLLRRLKRDVEKELPSKYEHLVLCPLSKRQRFLYDEFMSRAQTRNDLSSGVYQKIANILMQLRKVCNHPDLFEVRPIVTSFSMESSAIADFEIKELLVRRRLLLQDDADAVVNLDLLGLQFIHQQNTSWIAASETRLLDATSHLPFVGQLPGAPPPHDVCSKKGFKTYREFQQRAATIARWAHIGYLNRLRCNQLPVYSNELLTVVNQLSRPLLPASAIDRTVGCFNTSELVHFAIKSYETRGEEMAPIVDKFACITPAVVARDLPRLALSGHTEAVHKIAADMRFDAILHKASVKLQIAFPDPSLLQYDCGKLQELTRLLRERKAGGHRVLIFTQMTRILDILEIFLNFHGHLYLRLDGATKIEDRQYVTERFNSDPRIFCFIASSRSGGVGINLTGADTVVFYDSDFNPQMDRQCEDRAHRIGQIRDVHIYRFISQHTVEEAMLRKANQKRSLDDIVIQKGEFDWRSLFSTDDDTGAEVLTKALEEFADTEDAYAAKLAAREAGELEGADQADFGEDAGAGTGLARKASVDAMPITPVDEGDVDEEEQELEPEQGQEQEQEGLLDVAGGEGDNAGEDQEDEGGTTVDYMLSFVQYDYDFFRDWKV